MSQKSKNSNITFKIFDTNSDEDEKPNKILKKKDFQQQPIEREALKKIYLYVPFKYKDDAKNKCAKWDNNKSKWYTYENNPDAQYLIDLYHPDNFTHDFFGAHRKIHITTKEQRDKKCLAEKEEYEKLKKDWVEKNGSDEGFGLWHSVNVLNHE